MGNGPLARHDAAVRERTLETTFAEREVCNAILRIAQAFHEQEALGQVDTPGGFEHMGDVWSRICEWEKLIIGGRALKTPQPAVES